METIVIHDGIGHKIKWHLTGEIAHRVDCHDWDEVVKGECQYGIIWYAIAKMSMGEILKIEYPEIL